MDQTPQKPLLPLSPTLSGTQTRTQRFDTTRFFLEDDCDAGQHWVADFDHGMGIEVAAGATADEVSVANGYYGLVSSGERATNGAVLSSSRTAERCSGKRCSKNDSGRRCQGGYDCSGCGGCICSQCAVLCPRCDQLKCNGCMTVAPVSSCCCGAVNQSNSSSVFRFAAPGAMQKIAALTTGIPPQQRMTSSPHVSKGERVPVFKSELCCHQCARNLFRREYCKGKL